MHIKHIHETMEKLSKYACDEACKSVEEIDTKELGEVVDMVKDLSEAEYYARIAKAMEESEKEDEEEAKRIMKEMKEQYGEEEGERRFYDNYRYANGRFAPRGRGTRRRGFSEPTYHMPLDMYHTYSAEEMRDLDRENLGRMYYSSGNMGGSSSGGNMSGNSGNSDGNTRSYTDGYDDGQRRGYSDGYERGRNDGSRNNSSRYDRAKRGYEEHKMNKDDSPEGKKKSMENLEEYMRELGTDMSEMIGKMDSSEKAMAKSKLQTLIQKIG